jgi:hypothetical protein
VACACTPNGLSLNKKPSDHLMIRGKSGGSRPMLPNWGAK